MREEEGEENMIVMWGCKCPLGNCNKQGKWLGAKQAWYSERRARQAVFDHIIGCPAHAHIDTDGAAAEADLAELVSWTISRQDEAVQADERTHGTTAEELAEWADQSVFYEDAEKRAAKKGRPSEAADSSRRVKPKHHPGSSSSVAHRRTRSPAQDRGPTTVAQVSRSLEGQIQQQTRNAYVFVKAASSR
jgi:hypothetical protein